MLPEDNDNPATVRLDSNFETKALGLTWNCQQDLFKFQLSSIDIPKAATKRNVLSLIARVFDPLEFLTPVMIKAKIILQKLWQLKLNWDELISVELREEFYNFCTSLHLADNFEIPRNVIPIKN